MYLLFEHEDDIAMMIIDMGYKIEKREYSIIKNTHSGKTNRLLLQA